MCLLARKHTPVLQADAVPLAEMAVDDFGKAQHDAEDVALADAKTLGSLLANLARLDGSLVNGYRLVHAEGAELRLRLFLDSVFHKLQVLPAKVRKKTEQSKGQGKKAPETDA